MVVSTLKSWKYFLLFSEIEDFTFASKEQKGNTLYALMTGTEADTL